MPTLTPEEVARRYRQAKERRAPWESHWSECYDYALPQRDGALGGGVPGEKKTDKLFDGTAPDAVDQLAASLLAQLTPPWARWFGLAAGHDARIEDRDALGLELERIAAVLQNHFDRSNFAVEMHQCYLDLVTAGSASLLIEETKPGEPAAFRFAAVPLAQVAFEEGLSGRLDTTFRRWEMRAKDLRERFPSAELPALPTGGDNAEEARVPVIEAVVPDERGFQYMAIVESGTASGNAQTVLAQGRFRHSPFINFRWIKAPGEIYGRSPVMKALPDIKTANKVVELVLKNASIAVTGIWQADDDGVLNPATIRLTPGTIIPKAVGSAGLTPLEAPGRFDVSELVLSDLRGRIRQALLVDKLGQIDSPRMTATEVLARAAEMARILGATFGRLQSELLTPLIVRTLSILARRGEIAEVRIDGRLVQLEYRSPLARTQARQDANDVLAWLGAVQALGPEAMRTVDAVAVARRLARAYGVPGNLMREPREEIAGGTALDALAAGMAAALETPEQIQ